MSEEKIYTILELIEQYKNNTLPPEVVVFKYLSKNGPGNIHRDEIRREAIIGGIYATMHQDKIIGSKTRPDDPVNGVNRQRQQQKK
jgi:hypothetical protein